MSAWDDEEEAENLERETFRADDLVPVPEPVNPVMLRSGGPIMEVVTEGPEGVLCKWPGGLEVFRPETLWRLTRY
jgi:uncharacterized protein YodC (DUF2158 family)